MGGVVRPAIVDRACGTRRWIRRRPTPGGVAERIVRRRSASPFWTSWIGRAIRQRVIHATLPMPTLGWGGAAMMFGLVDWP
jgi:hypothetical protein